LGSRKEPAIEAVSLGDLETGCLAIILFQRQASHDLHRSHQYAPWQPIHVDAELVGDSGFLLGLDSIEPGLDKNSLSEMRSPGSDLNSLVTQ
jgi:hypothetical protein